MLTKLADEDGKRSDSAVKAERERADQRKATTGRESK
jgi:hypothetical protein